MKRRLVEGALALAATALFVLAVCWRLWTPIDGARRVLPPGALAWLIVLGAGVTVWLRTRAAGRAAAALAAGVAVLVSLAIGPTAGLALTPWAVCAAELWGESPSWPRAFALGVPLGLIAWLGLPSSLPSALALAAPLGALARGVEGRSTWRARATLIVPVVLVVAAFVVARGRIELELSFPTAATWTGLLVPRWPGATFCYPGVVIVVAAVVAVATRPAPRTLALGALAIMGLGSSNLPIALLALCALAPVGLEARTARAYVALGLAAAAILGLAVTLTASTGRATPRHDALVLAFFAWCTSLVALRQLAAAAPAARRLLLVAVAVVGISDVWLAAEPQIEARFKTPTTTRR